MAKSKKTVEVAEEVEAVDVETVAEVEELPVKVSEPETVEITSWESTFRTGAWTNKTFTYKKGAKDARIDGSPAGVQGINAVILNPQGDNAQVKITVTPPSGSGESILSMPRADAVALVAALSTARADAPTVSSRIGGAIANVRQTVARKTRGCKSCGG